MSRLDELIEELCPDGVEYKEIKDIATVSIGEFVHKNKQLPNGPYPVYNGGITNTGFYDEYNRTANKIIISARGANAGYVNRVFVDFWSGNSCYTVSVDDESVDWNFVYYALKNSENKLRSIQQKGGIPAISKKQIEEFVIPLPPLPVQQEIVHILDNFTELITEIESEIEARKKQYECYRDRLLSQEELNKLCLDEVEYKPLWEVTIWDKKFNAVERYKQKKVYTYPYMLASDLFELEKEEGNVYLLSTGEKTGWTTEDLAGNNLCEGEVVTIPWGKSRPVKDVIKYYKGKFVTADNRIVTSADTKILSNKYLYYWLLSQGEVIDTFYRGSGIKHPSMKDVLDMQIPVPPLPVQQEIVRILDNFTELIEELTAELEARQKQYEYYRDKLLSFKEVSS
jgi:type I restriction enzyme S subunit